MENMPSILTPDFGLLFWMLLAFGVVFFLLAKYGFPAITKAVEDRKNYMRDIRSQVADLSVLIAEKVIRRQLDNAEEQEKYIDRILNDMNKG